MAYEKTWQFDTNRLYTPGTVAQPYITSAVASAGGSLTASAYFYAISAIVNGIESVVSGSNEYRLDVPATGQVSLAWTMVPGASAYTVYRGNSAHSYNRVIQLGNVTSYVDNGTGGFGTTTWFNTPLDRSVETGKYISWYYKAFLTGQIGGATQGLWTIYGSSDGVTAGLDAVDRWTATFSPSKIISASGGSAHSWIVLRSPTMAGKNYYLLMDFNASPHAAACSYSFNAPTGGSTTAPPTFAIPVNAGSVGFGPQSTANQLGAFRMHGQLATDGSFNILATMNNTRKFVSGFHFHLLANARLLDQNPVAFFANADTLINTGFNTVLGTSGNSIDYSDIWMATQNGGSFDTYFLILPNTANWPGSEDAFDLTFADYPLWVGKRGTGNGFVGVRGRLQDIVLSTGLYATGTGPAVYGMGYDAQSPPQYVTVGNFRYPIDQLILWE